MHKPLSEIIPIVACRRAGDAAQKTPERVVRSNSASCCCY